MSFKSGSTTLIYKAEQKSKITETSLKIYDSEIISSNFVESKFTIDVNQPAYKLVQHKKVVDQAKIIAKDFKSLKVHLVSELVKTFVEELISDNNINSSSQLVQSIFFHNAILNTIKRMEKENECGCTPHPGYFVEKTNFWCQEDYFISPKDYLSIIVKSGYKMNETEKTLFHFLEKKQNQKLISIDEVFGFIETKTSFLERIDLVYSYEIAHRASRTSDDDDDRRGCLRGSDWGCCGNYAGCCWYSSVLCLIHDIACIRCTPRILCFPGCVPDR